MNRNRGKKMLKVFLVEDESVIREGLRDKIPWEQYGYRFVGEAADGEMALPLIRKARPDVLITDIKMPFMDGLSLSKMVRTEFPKIKIIIISGYDDFEYAREAIEAGVDQYMLKPVTRAALRKVLLELKEKIAQDVQQDAYRSQFQSEMREYEQFSRRQFFEKVLGGGEISVKDIYEEAGKLSLELSASCYNLLFLCLQEKAGTLSDGRAERFMRRQEEVLHYFLRHPQYIPFRWNANCYGVLVKAENGQMEELTEKALEHIRQICSQEEDQMDWYVAVGRPVERLSLLSECYRSVNHYFAYRFIMPDLHLLTESTLASYLTPGEENNIGDVDPSKMAPEIIRDFLSRGSSSEIHDFVESYLQSIREALESRMFRDYVVLNIRFTVMAYMESIGAEQEEYVEEMDHKLWDINMKPSEVFDYFVDTLQAAVCIRDRRSSYQSGRALRHALEYIDSNYAMESLSLSSVAAEADVSASYLSAVFSQSMQKTFIEYVTEKRMEKAKKLLRATDKSSGEIALEVGYKDSHYFSFVFKKTQGVSPREYRNGKKD
ncbi:response regulator [[Clostridium] hylemonae]|uniref:response regulator n=2 Tax=[Clostridium] hylemonae TaxID=89153 RepID=UPI001D090412|nr:response regulator [[Clostridium] hylemonae]